MWVNMIPIIGFLLKCNWIDRSTRVRFGEIEEDDNPCDQVIAVADEYEKLRSSCLPDGMRFPISPRRSGHKHEAQPAKHNNLVGYRCMLGARRRER